MVMPQFILEGNMRPLRTTVIASFALLICSSSIASEQSTKFEDAFAAAQAFSKTKTPEDQSYDGKVATEFGTKEAIGRCRDLLKKKMEIFVVVIRLGADGAIEESQVDPETKAASCVLDAGISNKFTPPPRPSYWTWFRFALPK
jgi:hypothetical protein